MLVCSSVPSVSVQQSKGNRGQPGISLTSSWHNEFHATWSLLLGQRSAGVGLPKASYTPAILGPKSSLGRTVVVSIVSSSP